MGGMMNYSRNFDAARKAQGFRSQAHLDAFFAASDHIASCANCKARDGYVLFDDGYQPTSGRCDVASALDSVTSELGR
jgi:hypothetical protein